MSAEKLVEGLARQIGRRAFLRTVGASSVATLLALMGHPVTASHGSYCTCCSYVKCCQLCCSPSSSCGTARCTSDNQNQHVTWCWYCDHTDGRTYKCCECKDPLATCQRDCHKVYRSYYELTGFAPEA